MQQKAVDTNGNRRRLRTIRIVIALLVIPTMVLVTAILYQRHQQKTWMWTLPVQCFENPWEVAWQKVPHPGETFPSTRYGASHEFTELIIDYYATQGIEVLDVKVKWPWRVATCFACFCPKGDTLYLLVNNTEVEKLRALCYSDVQPGVFRFRSRLTSGRNNCQTNLHQDSSPRLLQD